MSQREGGGFRRPDLVELSGVRDPESSLEGVAEVLLPDNRVHIDLELPDFVRTRALSHNSQTSAQLSFYFPLFDYHTPRVWVPCDRRARRVLPGVYFCTFPVLAAKHTY